MADDSNIVFSVMAPHVVDFIKVIGLPKPLKQHVKIEKREFLSSSPDEFSQLLILQNILSYEDIASNRLPNLDVYMKQKHAIKDYLDPETFRDELQ